jgi:hypothetical protein
MEIVDLVISGFSIAIPIIIFLTALLQRLTKLETKFDCLLMWVLEIDPTQNIDDIQMKHKRDKLKKQIEETLNGDACKVPEA